MNEITIIGAPALPAFKPELSPETLAEKENALATSALIGKVTNREENDAANNARKGLREMFNGLEKQRKRMSDPFIEAQRLLIRVVEPHIDELKQEDARLEMLVKDFTLAEQRRIREEKEAQEREIQRIELEKQAEILRIAREQAAKEEAIRQEQLAAQRKEREEREAVERQANEAKNKAQREAAEVARIEAAQRAEVQRVALQSRQDELARQSTEQMTAASERAAEATRIESRTVEITRSVGQVTKKKWVIDRINDHQLYKVRPDLVREFVWDKLALTEALNNSGGKISGVTAHEDISVGVRGRPQRTIDV